MLAMFKDKVFWSWLTVAVLMGALFGCVAEDWTVFALVFTAVILVWYSAETRGLRLHTREANRLAVHPGLTLRYIRSGENQGGDWIFILSNVGKGVALNPEIAVTSKTGWKVDLNGVNAIYPGDVVEVFFRIPGGEKVTGGAATAFFQAELLKATIYFSSALDPKGRLSTEVEISNPPHITITNTNWL